jgi:iron complex outermembrane receptor protein
MPLPVLIRNTSGEGLKAEKMAGFEFGYRSQVSASFNFDASAYRYRYRDRVSGTPGPVDMVSYYPYAILQEIDLCNCSRGSITGAELSAEWQVLPAWRLQLSYSRTRIRMDATSNPAAQADGSQAERATPVQYGSLRSQWNVSSRQQLDAWLRGAAGYARINAPYTNTVRVPGYVTLDMRYAHKIDKSLELAVTGRNLIGARRVEFVSDYIPSVPLEIGPSLLLSARWKF